ncbi:MAG: hypothetical protein ACYTGP_01995 [Planctomycetota bacterium]|jgi:hypothetical protein
MTKLNSILCIAAIFCLGATTQVNADTDPNPDSGINKSGEAPCSMDMDVNGGFDFGDYLWVIANWGPCGSDPLGGETSSNRCHGDVDADGQIGFAEILFVLNHFGQNCSPSL